MLGRTCEIRKRGDVHERRDGDATSVDPAEAAGRLAVAREGKQHARAREEAGVGRLQHGGEQDGVDDMRSCSETSALEHYSER